MKFILFGYYDLKESILAAAKALERKGHTIISYPLFQVVYDKRVSEKDYTEEIIKLLRDTKPDAVLWWFCKIPLTVFDNLKKVFTELSITSTPIISTPILSTPILSVMFNWDDPWCWIEPMANMKEKAKYFDLALPTCQESTQWYLNNGSKNSKRLLPGFDPEHFSPIAASGKKLYPTYKCDVSFCCTNLYLDKFYKEQLIPRKKIIDDLYQCHLTGKFTFHIYGPEFLRKYYPESYKGYANYDQLNEVFQTSKINISTHVCGNYEGYVNERCITVAGAGALLLVDRVKGIEQTFTPNKEVLIIQPDYIKQIQDILSEYSRYEAIKVKARERALKEYTWDKWAENLLVEVDTIRIVNEKIVKCGSKEMSDDTKNTASSTATLSLSNEMDKFLTDQNITFDNFVTLTKLLTNITKDTSLLGEVKNISDGHPDLDITKILSWCLERKFSYLGS